MNLLKDKKNFFYVGDCAKGGVFSNVLGNEFFVNVARLGELLRHSTAAAVVGVLYCQKRSDREFQDS